MNNVRFGLLICLALPAPNRPSIATNHQNVAVSREWQISDRLRAPAMFQRMRSQATQVWIVQVPNFDMPPIVAKAHTCHFRVEREALEVELMVIDIKQFDYEVVLQFA